MFPPATPESMGLPSGAILALVDRLEREGHDPHSLIVLREGHSLAEGWWAPYRRERVHRLYSLSKSFTSTAVGLAIDEGKLSLDDSVLGFFPDLAPEAPGENLRTMRVRDLLTMSCGQDADDRTSDLAKEPDGVWMRAFLRRPVPYAPGTHFFYNSSATYALSAILARVTGENLLDYLRPRLFDPLGIGPARWETDPNGIAVGGWGLDLTTDAIARFGQLLLQRGRWEGRPIVPEAWIDEATMAHADNSANENPDWRQGYGYQFWRSRHGFRADGAFGQFCLVLPERRLVVAITSATDDLQGVLDEVWEEILTKMGDAPLPDDPDAFEALQSALSTRRVFSPAGWKEPEPPTIAGLRVGIADWIENEEGIQGLMPGPVAARGRWAIRDQAIFQARLVSIESTESMTVVVEKGEAKYHARGTWGPREGILPTF